MPLKRTPTKNKKADKHDKTRKPSAEKNQSSCSSEYPMQASATYLNKSASETDLLHTNLSTVYQFTSPPDYISLRNKRSRDQMEDSLSTQLLDFQNEIKAMFTSFTTTQSNELKNLTTQLKEIQLTNYNIENSIAYLTSQNEEFRKRITDLETQAKQDKNYITLLENKLEDIQMQGRKSSFEIRNVPKLANENKEALIDMAVNLSKSVECDILSSDIFDIYRLKPKSGQSNNTPIIVEMKSVIVKNKILKAGKTFNIRHKTNKLCARHVGHNTHMDTPIYLCEHLTPKNSRLFFLARDLIKTNKFQFCWTAYGRVYARENEQTPVIQIFTENQVQELLAQGK